MRSSIRSSTRNSIRRLVSNHMIDRRSENVTVEEGDRRTWGWQASWYRLTALTREPMRAKLNSGYMNGLQRR